MAQLLLLALIGIVIYYGMKFFAGTNPAKVARLFKRIGGIGSLALAVLLLLRGRIDVALVAGGVGAWLLGWSAGPDWRMMLSHPSALFSGHRFQHTARLEEVEMSASGDVLNGRVRGQGRVFHEMNCDELIMLYQLCCADDVEGARMLEAYLDRRFPQWRAAGKGDAHAGNGRGRVNSILTEDEAYEVLGLARGASIDEITAAHRALMKKLHPDHGGTTSLAARINEAKDVLIRRHR